MAWIADKLSAGPLLPEGTSAFFARRVSETTGLGLMTCAGMYLAALASYAPGDPSFNAVTDAPIANWMGQPGAASADLMLQTFGLAAVLPGIVGLAWGFLWVRKLGVGQLWLRLVLLLIALLLLSIALAAVPPTPSWPLAASLGGVAGQVLLERVSNTIAALHLARADLITVGVAGTLTLPGLATLVWALGLPGSDWKAFARGVAFFNHALGNGLLKLLGRLRSAPARDDYDDYTGDGDLEEEEDPIDDGVLRAPRRRIAGSSAASPKSKKKKPPKAPGLVETPIKTLKTGTRAQAQRQRTLDLGAREGGYVPPPLDLLIAADPSDKNVLSKDALEQNAVMLSGVLEDFGVRGDIVKVRPGPVVTLYELEPAPGTKTSRVIGLADDIARSMSAISVRVATVPGRSVIGIELPNQTREMVTLRELLASQDFEKSKGALNLALGKDIGGLPIIVDLARMPHLLIAGTTGSGKSVGVNAMICSLLYQHGPEQCRFIMIDPKMLELSVYDGIPHLLSPVVTDPGKAVVALKWAVREMEERYRLMSQLAVRNISGYNQRLIDAVKKGEELTRRVQTGFDDMGKPVFEDMPLSMEPLPFIVIIVDEMADLMMVAGKDVEVAIQRLAQMARAAGIHLVMATQRPSVDVITGTIKANFPTRVSFQVTSKIDSRTILGEQGAEQLLGQGDMLYMAGGGRITRVHAPFVSDEEVQDIVLHLKDQGAPDYIEAVTEEDEPSFGDMAVAGGGSREDELYDEAVAMVAREGKASTSFVQRHLQIGYNRAARIIERMEAEGVVSKANRVGRREVLISDVSKAS
ncbi:MAG: DNA translocase FtsK 4TM domain-containing protein [Rhodospirillales bacterium]|nr:DNA translocase FtsK 4TM domain-containing protein [Rhodospirillales bacterium]